MYTSGTLCCKWCGKDLSGATLVTYLNGNQAVCDLCLMKAMGAIKYPLPAYMRDWETAAEDRAWINL
jgi:hypothetical protein